MKHLIRLIGIALLLAAMCIGAAAETARVVTPGGKVNVRKTADEKGRIQMSVPNRTMVDVLEAGDEWCLIRWKKKEGYIRTEYLRLPSAMVGCEVYPDDQPLLLHEQADTASPVAGISNVTQRVTVLSVEDGWAQVRTASGAQGWVETAQMSYQRTEPASGVQWITLKGAAQNACTLRTAADASSGAAAELTAGQAIEVMAHDKDWSLVCADGVWGYLPTGMIRLSGISDESAVPAGDEMDAARGAASAAMKKAFKAFAKTKATFVCTQAEEWDGIAGPLAWCVWLSEDGRVLYGALVQLADSKVLYKEDFAAFSAEPVYVEPIPVGTLNMTLSADTLSTGAVLDISLETWSTYAEHILLRRDGAKYSECDTKGHRTMAFRPREAGTYTLTVTVTDEEKNTAEAMAEFTVTAQTETVDPLAMYSQKDGWWKDKAYRKRNLESSGCAIFALAHALQRMDITGEEASPEKLAAKFALCLTDNGTNNGRLIREAAEAFGFSTKGDLIESKEKIVTQLQNGAMFSFSVARGHIAMIDAVSEDGKMVRVVDSAPTATFERIVNTAMYIEKHPGQFVPITSLEDVEGARWYFETDGCGALTYWMETGYAAKRGVRLIVPAER